MFAYVIRKLYAWTCAAIIFTTLYILDIYTIEISCLKHLHWLFYFKILSEMLQLYQNYMLSILLVHTHIVWSFFFFPGAISFYYKVRTIKNVWRFSFITDLCVCVMVKKYFIDLSDMYSIFCLEKYPSFVFKYWAAFSVFFNFNICMTLASMSWLAIILIEKYIDI